MKKITLLLTMLLIGFISHAQFPENFDGGVIPATWAIFAGDGEAATQEAWTGDTFTSGTGFAICEDEDAGFETQDWLVSPLTSIGTTNSLLAFNEQTMYTQVYEPATMSVWISTTSQTDISSFTSLSSLSATQVFAGTGGVRSVDLSAYEGQDIYIAWVLTQTYGDGWIIYALNLQNQNASAPDVCTNMAPVDTATDVDIVLNTAGTTKMVMFSWDAATAGDPSTSYDWYFGATADAVTDLVSGFDGTVDGGGGITWGTTVATGWQPNTTYYWKVASVNAGGGTDSPIFSFTTSAADPLGVEGFSIEALSVSPNPVKDLITINSPVGFDSVKVFNQLGQLVLTSSSDLMNNNKLDLSALNPGMYLMQINADNKSKTVNIIKE